MAMAAPWNLSSSFPSARQRELLFLAPLAFAFTISLCSSNLAIVAALLWTLKIAAMAELLLQAELLLLPFAIAIAIAGLRKLVWKMISTMLRAESPSFSSVTAENGNPKTLSSGYGAGRRKP
jgi:hypothetical protein